MKKGIVTRLMVCLLLLLQLVGCAGRQAFSKGEELIQQGKYDAAVQEFFRAVQARPESHEYRMRLQNARGQAAREHLESGRRLLRQGDYRGAAGEFQQAAALDPSSPVAQQEQKKAESQQRAEELVAQGEQFYRARKFNQARNAVEEALSLSPAHPQGLALLEKLKGEGRTMLDGFDLDVASDKPITLKFKDAEIRDVFNILSRLSGINFLFDEDVKAQKVSVLLENATFAQALELLLRLNNLERKVLNAKTILIYPQTKEKEKKFEDQIIQTFYLSNIDAKKAVNLLRTMLQLRKIYVHEELNALVIRDTPSTVSLAQQIIEAADRSDSEVVFELELVEVSHTDSLDVGTRLSNYGTSFGLADPSSNTIGTVTTGGLSRLDFLYTIPSASFNFQKQMTDSEILANPKIRVKNKEKAKVHIGSREPIVTNTLTAQGDVTSTNVQYVDVGVKLDVEPTVQLDNTVVTKLSLEVSNVSSRQKIGDNGQGGEALTISTTNAQTSLILRDGQQTVIGGLIRDDLNRSKDSIPLLGQIPFLGNLISGHKKDKTKREILLSITPYIVKNIEMPRREISTIWSGGEDDLEAGPRFGSFATVLEPEVSKTPPAPAPALQVPPPAAVQPVQELSPVSPLAPMEPMEPIEPISQPDAPTGEPTPGEPAEGASALAVETAALTTPEPLPALPLPPVDTPAQIRLLAPSQVRTGEELAVAVLVENIRDLYSAPLFVTFDPQRLAFVRAEEGDFLKAAGQSTVFTVSTDAQGGRLIVGYKQGVGGAGASGSGNLFHLVFEGKTPGQAQVGLDRLNFRNPAGNRLPVTGAQLPVEVR